MVLAAVLSAATASAAGFSESWYMYRGNANMEIGNYKAAIEAFEKVLESNPDNRKAMRSLGLAYERQGLKDKSIELFDRYLQKYDDDPEIAFKQAEALEWARYAYREKDVLKYYRMGLKQRDDPKRRLKYASHLAKTRETSQEAVVQYERVIAVQPRNAEAHRGLAKAYAWLGDRDRALYHANLADRYAMAETGDLTALRRDMTKGREPTLEGIIGFLAQPQDPFELYAVRLGSRVKGDLTPFTTTTLEGGLEYFGDSSDNSTGGYLAFGTQARFNPSNRIDGMLEYHGAALANPLAYTLEYTYAAASFSLRPGVKHELKYDSLPALVGSRVSGQLFGAARSTLFYTDLAVSKGALQVDATPFAGWVEGESLDNNGQVGLDAKVAMPFWSRDTWTVSGEYLVYLTHYANDQSEFDTGAAPLAGYFSPRLFVSQTPRLVATHVSTAKNELSVAAGPAIQYIDEARNDPALRIGADAHVSYTARVPDRLLLKFMADLTQITGIQTRLQVQGLLVYTF
jgi:tetratricopeptide (TPR) repeat protein